MPVSMIAIVLPAPRSLYVDQACGARTSGSEYESDGVFGAIGYTAETPLMPRKAGRFATFVYTATPARTACVR